MIEDHPNPTQRWRNRRRMAWASLAAGLLYPLAFYLVDSPHLAGIAMPFYTFVGVVVGVYIGSATYESCQIGLKHE